MCSHRISRAWARKSRLGIGRALKIRDLGNQMSYRRHPKHKKVEF